MSSPDEAAFRRSRRTIARVGAAAPLLLPALLLVHPGAAAAQDRDSTARAPAAPSLSVRALLHVEHVSGEPAETPPERGFGLRRARLIVQGALDPRSSVRLMVDPSVLAVGPAGAAPFRGVPLVEAYLEHRLHPAATLRGGQQRLPFGLAATTAAPSLATPEYPLASRVLVQRVSAFRDIGLALAGQRGRLEYGVGVFGGAGINVRRDNDGSVDLIGRASYAAAPGWTVGLSGWTGHSGALYRVEGTPRRTFFDDADFTRWGIDTRYARAGLQLAAEYLSDRTEPSPGAVNPVPGESTLRRSGWYAQAAARPRPGARLELAGRYDRWDGGRAEDEVDEITGGASWYLSERAAPDDPRRGRLQNVVQRSSRLMAFAESARAGDGGWRTRLRIRWELLF